MHRTPHALTHRVNGAAYHIPSEPPFFVSGVRPPPLGCALCRPLLSSGLGYYWFYATRGLRPSLLICRPAIRRGSHLAAVPAAGIVPHCAIFHCLLCISWHFNSPAISYMKFPQNRTHFFFVSFSVMKYSQQAIFCPQFSPLLRNLTPPCAKKSAFWATLGLPIAFEMRYTAR